MRHQEALEAIEPPVSAEEARVLVTVFGDDDCFGLAWSVLHLIETAPAPALHGEPPRDQEWARRLWDRMRRADEGAD